MTNQAEREEILAKAAERETKAKALLAEFTEWRKRADAFAPQPYYERRKKNNVEALTSRLQSASWELGHAKDRFKYEDKVAAEAEAKKEQLVREAERKVVRDKYQTEAIKWLLERGQKLGEDFTLGSAVNVAETLAYEDEVKRLTAAGTWHEFNGQNCDGPCKGWDGVSHRCDCGNRRVSWTMTDYHTFRKPSIYGEAY